MNTPPPQGGRERKARVTALTSVTDFPLAPPYPPTKLGPQLPRAVADENTLPNRQGAVIPYQQEVKDFVCHPGIEKQRPGRGAGMRTRDGCPRHHSWTANQDENRPQRHASRNPQ